MTIDYSLPDKVILSMIDYIGNMIDDLPEEMRGESVTPATHHLFDILEYVTKLSWTNADLFSSFCGADIVPVKLSTPIHKVGSLILVY